MEASLVEKCEIERLSGRTSCVRKDGGSALESFSINKRRTRHPTRSKSAAIRVATAIAINVRTPTDLERKLVSCAPIAGRV